MKSLVLVVSLVAACTSSSSVLCSDGARCPADTVCAQVTLTDNTMADLCASNDEVAACVGKNEGDACATGTCHGGACVANACGNHLLDSGEQCDDGNQKSGDGCSADCLSNETCGNGVIDLAKGEQCDDGPDHVGHDGCSSACIVEGARWLPFIFDRPVTRFHAAFAYDEQRHRMVMFDGDTNTGTAFDITLEWDGFAWHTMTPTTTPTIRTESTMAYDAKHHRVVMFSGTLGSADTWTYDGTTWTEAATAHRPPVRVDANMVYDSNHQVVVMFGGYSVVNNTVPLNDTWTFDGTDWTQVTTPTSPTARAGQAMAYDPHRNVVVMFGGVDSVTLYGDLWEFDGTTWTQKSFGTGPAARGDSKMAFDPVANKVMLTGGNTSGGAQKDAWEWDGASWAQVANVPTPLTGFSTHGMVTNASHGRIELFDTGGNMFHWNGGSWSLAPNGLAVALPPAADLTRESAMGFLDLVHRTIVIYGGTNSHEQMSATIGNGALDDTLVLGDGVTVIPAAGSPTPKRWGGAIAYDTKRDTAVLFGGCGQTLQNGDVSDCTAAALYQDTWQWHANGWTAVAIATKPPGREHAMMAYDEARDRSVLFGGIATSNLSGLDDTWLYDGAGRTWTLATPTTVPPPRFAAAMGYDPIRQQVIMFGGNGPNAVFYDETWMWDGTNWTKLAPAISPPARYAASLIWDPARRRLVLAEGRITVGTTIDETWEWDGTTWSKPAVVPSSGLTTGRGGYVGVASPDGAGVVVLGGFVEEQGLNFTDSVVDRYRLRWDGPDSYESCSTDDGDHDGLVGCADPDCWWACSSRCMPGDSSCTAPPTCGDGGCDAATESCDTCPADCGVCAPHCGDFTCNGTDSMTSCPGDCP